VVEPHTKNGHFKDSKKKIRMENNMEPATEKTKTEMVERYVWWSEGAESEKLKGISYG
jgi:hypothetical protein